VKRGFETDLTDSRPELMSAMGLGQAKLGPARDGSQRHCRLEGKMQLFLDQGWSIPEQPY
jgi:hypothetical protein